MRLTVSCPVSTACILAAIGVAACGAKTPDQPQAVNWGTPTDADAQGKPDTVSESIDASGQPTDSDAEPLDDLEEVADGEPGTDQDAVTDGTAIDVPAQPDIPPPPDGYTGPLCTKHTVCQQQMPTAPYCKTDAQMCVECLIDVHCKDQKICKENVCTAVNCNPDSQVCDGPFLDVCNADGKSYTTKECPQGQSCIDDKCLACDPGKVFCANPEPGQSVSKKLMQCASDGSATSVKELCKGTALCTAAKCQNCTPGLKTCEGDKAMACKDDGTAMALFMDCAAKGWTCYGGQCVDPCDQDIKSKTNVGCDYWAVDLDNAAVPCANETGFCDAQNSQFAVIVSNTKDKAALVKVTAGSGQTAAHNVQAGALKIINLPDPSWKIKPLNQDGTNINKNVYRIQSDQPIVAYQFNPLLNVGVFSNDASLLLPSNGIGNEYWIVTREQSHKDLRGYLTVVATQPGSTHVKVVVAGKTLASPSVNPLSAVPAMNPGGTKEFDLAQGQVLNIETDAIGSDLTGSWIQADKAVAVFAGSESANSPNTDHCVQGKCEYGKLANGEPWSCATNADCPQTCCADHLEEQLFPTSSWGLQYVATKLKPRGKEKDAWRIVASENDTVVSTNPPQPLKVGKLAKGQWTEFESLEDFIITANKPIQVAQFMASQNAPDPNNDTCDAKFIGEKVCKYYHEKLGTQIGCTKHADCPNIMQADDSKIGDPDMLITLSTEQFLSDYVFLVPNAYKENFINLVVPAGAAPVLDGQPVADASFKKVAGEWSVAVLAVKAGTHTLVAKKPVGLNVYGWSDYVSYSYPGGSALK
jgi:hypothetical protein